VSDKAPLPPRDVRYRERLDKPRRFVVEHEGRKYHMLLPTPFLERQVLRATKGDGGDGWYEQATRNLVEATLTDWEGVTEGDILHNGDDSVLEFSPALARVLLDERLDVLDTLRDRLAEHQKGRRERVEADAGNSASASTGS
jgi:hypothetical protein